MSNNISKKCTGNTNEDRLILSTEESTLLLEFSEMLVKNIKDKRKSIKVTQEELSKLSKVNRTTIAKLESYQRIVVNLNVILKLLDSLDLKLTIIDK